MPVRSFDELVRLFKTDGNKKIYNESALTGMADFSRYNLSRDSLSKYSSGSSFESDIKGRKLLMITHELSLTGAPIALLNFAKAVKANGGMPVILSPYDGPLARDSAASDITILTDKDIFGASLDDYIELFDAVVVNTLELSGIVKHFIGTNIPVLWWMHESALSYSIRPNIEKFVPVYLTDNISVCTVGAYARKCLLEHRPDWDVHELLYYLPDIKSEGVIDKQDKVSEKLRHFIELKDGLTVFADIGLIQYRKGQDILIDAIDKLSDDEIAKSLFVFAGGTYSEDIYAKVLNECDRYPDNVLYLGQLSQSEIALFYEYIDCLICSSRDDPMPIVATEAMMHRKSVICSENTGTAEIIRKADCGIVYEGDSSDKLADSIRQIISNKDQISIYGERGRDAFLNYFTEEIFVRECAVAIRRASEGSASVGRKISEYTGTVSIVIPTYNAGGQFDQLLDGLLSQKHISKIEIIVVDSGSSDGTLTRAQRDGVSLYEIAHEDFSHSYARNYGAEKSSGDIIIFMTQDALPIGDDWVLRMIEPLINGNAAAVCARELNPEGTELYYRVSTESYSRVIGIDKCDRINYIDRPYSPMELRIKAGLTDISCAIRRDIFAAYQYRYDYAEDMDMGVRLLKDGYRIMLSGNIRVLHGHNRPAAYYLKRCLVDCVITEMIIPGLQGTPSDVHTIALRTVSFVSAVSNSVYKTAKYSHGSSAVAYLDELKAELSKYTDVSTVLASYADNIDDTLMRVTDILAEYCSADCFGDYELVHGMIYYIDNELIRYISESDEAHEYGDNIVAKLNDCIMKQLCTMTGYELGRLRWSNMLYERFGFLMNGV